MKSNLTSSDSFKIVIKHGGELIRNKILRYVGGRKYVLRDCKLEEWSLQEIITALKGLGYKGIVKI